MGIIEDGEICAVTEFTNKDFPKTRLAIISFLTYNEWFNGNIYILLPNSGILENHKESLNSIYGNLKYIQTGESDANKLRRFSFQIKSKCTIYFSKDSLFQKDISHCTSSSGISSILRNNMSIDYNKPINDIFDSNIMIISNDVDRDLIIKNLNISSNTDINIGINQAVRLAEIKVFCHFIGINASIVKNKDYPKFVRYSKSTSYISYENTNHSDYSRINLYWISINKKAMDNLSRVRTKNFNPRIDNKHFDSNTVSINHLNKKTALCTICNDDFIKGAQVMIHSFLKFNKWFNGDIIVMYSNKLSSLSDDSKNKLRVLYDKIIFRNIDESSYQSAINRFVKQKGLHLNFMPSLFTFEVFEIEGYEQLLYVDSDILHANSMLDMIKIDGDFIVTPAALTYPSKKHHDFSGGVFMIRGKMISSGIKDKLLQFSLITHRFKLLDQTIMNDFFKNQSKSWASNDYNCSKRCFDDRNFHNFNDKISLIHYVADKPWNAKRNLKEKNYSKLESLWINYYNRFIKRKELSTSKKVIVIGNSPNVINHKIGDKIDKFDIVIRVNDFRTIGFEKYVGQKTDIVMTSFATNFNTEEYNSISANQVMMSLFDKKNQDEYLNNRIEKYGLSNVNIMPDYYYLGLNEEVGLSGIKRCSSGTIALKWAIDNYPDHDIYFYGIDLIKEDAHYFKQSSSNVQAWKKSIEIYHDFEKEKDYINVLLNNGIIKKIV